MLLNADHWATWVTLHEYLIKYRTFTCLVLTEIVNQDMYQKNGPVKYRTTGNPKPATSWLQVRLHTIHQCNNYSCVFQSSQMRCMADLDDWLRQCHRTWHSLPARRRCDCDDQTCSARSSVWTTTTRVRLSHRVDSNSSISHQPLPSHNPIISCLVLLFWYTLSWKRGH